MRRFFRGAVQRFHVEDWSMAPLFFPGDRLRVDTRAYLTTKPKAGDVVVILDPEVEGRKLLKRVERVLPRGEGDLLPPHNGPRLFVIGDNALRSRDSRHFGPISIDQVVGLVRSQDASLSPTPAPASAR